MKSRTPNWKKNPIVLSMVLSLAGSFSVMAETGVKEKQVQIEVSEIPLDSALQSVAKQFGKQIVFFSNVAEGLTATEKFTSCLKGVAETNTYV